MKKFFSICLITIFTCGLSFASGDAPIVGTWNGSLSTQGIKLRLSFNITDSTGALTATMDSPDQNAFGIPMDSCIFANDTLQISMAAIVGQYLGVMSEDGNTIIGTWTQGGQSFTLNLERGDKVVLNRPQEPKPPYPYLEEEITYRNEDGDATLAGTLTKPKTGGPFTTVLLITGSGAQDRDEMIFGHKPFKVLADHLTRKGIAVLRVDDRGYGKSTGDIMNATTADFSGDVMAGVEYLKSREDVDKNSIGLIGHSEGGVIAPIVATETDDVAFIVMLAGTGLPGDELLTQQANDILKADSTIDENELKYYSELHKMMLEVVKSDLGKEAAMIELKTAFSNWKTTLPPDIKAEVDSTAEVKWQASFEQALLPWMRYFIAYDPRPALRNVTCPVLALNGEKDIQVAADINLSEIEKALKEGGNTNYRIEKLPSLNHIFQTCETGTVSEYGEIEETFSPIVMQIISEWIAKVTE